jgi:hypothetical protein
MVMPHPSWNESYASGQLPWDTGQPEPLLVEFVTSGAVTPGPTLEIGTGTGTNAIWPPDAGFLNAVFCQVQPRRDAVRPRDDARARHPLCVASLQFSPL